MKVPSGAFSAANGLTSPEAVEQVLTVIIMFGTLWFGGAALLFGCIWRSHVKQPVHLEEKTKLKRRSSVAEQIHSPAAICERISEYIRSVFPVVYKSTPVLIRLRDELRKNHRYLQLFSAAESELSDQKRILTAVQLLTTQSVLIFLLASFCV